LQLAESSTLPGDSLEKFDTFRFELVQEVVLRAMLIKFGIGELRIEARVSGRPCPWLPMTKTQGARRIGVWKL